MSYLLDNCCIKNVLNVLCESCMYCFFKKFFLVLFKVLEILEMCSVSLFESEELVKNLKPLDLTEAGHRSWIDQVTLFNHYAFSTSNLRKAKCFDLESESNI